MNKNVLILRARELRHEDLIYLDDEEYRFLNWLRPEPDDSGKVCWLAQPLTGGNAIRQYAPADMEFEVKRKGAT